jgi:hypothetical protein
MSFIQNNMGKTIKRLHDIYGGKPQNKKGRMLKKALRQPKVKIQGFPSTDETFILRENDKPKS